jgi:O-antigen ligase
MEHSIIFVIILGVFLLTKNKWFRYSLIAFAALEFTLLTTYRSFAAFLGAISVILLLLLFARPKKYRLWMLAFISLFIFIFGLLLFNQKNNTIIVEYKEKFEKITNISEELKNDSGLTNRIALWKAGMDILKDRPILGYGWGIDKFKKLTHQENKQKLWKNKRPYVYELFFEKNEFLLPHNIFLDIAIQSGLVGVASFLSFLLMYIFYIIKIGTRSDSDTEYNFLIIIVGGIILIFMITNFLNSELCRTSGKIFFAVLGAGAAWINNRS